MIFEYEKDDIVRTAWLEGWGHPRPGPYGASLHGHSVGRYKDGTLVVVTDRFLYDPTGLEDLGGIPSTTQKRVTEVYSRQGDTLQAEVVVEDPLILEEPIRFTVEWKSSEAQLILPYECELDQARQPVQHADPRRRTNVREIDQLEPSSGVAPLGVRDR